MLCLRREPRAGHNRLQAAFRPVLPLLARHQGRSALTTREVLSKAGLRYTCVSF